MLKQICFFFTEKELESEFNSNFSLILLKLQFFEWFVKIQSNYLIKKPYVLQSENWKTNVFPKTFSLALMNDDKLYFV